MTDSPSTSSDPVAIHSRPPPVPHQIRQQQPNAPPPKQNSLANLLAAKRSNGATPIPPSLQAKMAAMANRASQAHTQSSPNIDTVTAVMHRAAIDSQSQASAPRTSQQHPHPHQQQHPPNPPSTNPTNTPNPIPEHPSLRAAQSYPVPGILRGAHAHAHPAPRPGGMAARRMKPNFSLKDINADFGASPLGGGVGVGVGGASGAGLGAGRPSLADSPVAKRPAPVGSPFSNFSKIVDPSGALNFSGKAVLHASGVDFSNGSSFAINMSQLKLSGEGGEGGEAGLLGKGNYGTVKKVLHLPTGVCMAMKEIRLELDEAKLNAIIMELDILHRAVAPEIVEFYGAFFIESCVYYCMEYMDAGSLDKLLGAGVPEDVLARIASSVVKGLKFLKDELQIIHRDIKPTNVLANLKGQIKLCDFGVSGQLEKSLAKTNIGCQSYMAPERIKGESQSLTSSSSSSSTSNANLLGTYTVSSDVWSVGLSMIEIGLGHYPYPPETYSNVFAQLTAIVHGEPPGLPEGVYGEEARDWVGRCLVKAPEGRATYAELLAHPFLVADAGREVDMVGWVNRALEHRRQSQSPSALPSSAATPPPSSGSPHQEEDSSGSV